MFLFQHILTHKDRNNVHQSTLNKSVLTDGKENKEFLEILELKKMFDKLNDINTNAAIPALEIELENSWASGHGINQTLTKLLGDNVHIIHPDLASIRSPASGDEDEALIGAVNYVKMIRGFYVDEEFRDDGLMRGEQGILNKPIIMILNTTSIKDPKSPQQEGGIHWQTCVILPRNYTPPFGESIKNTNEIVFFIDSKYENRTIPVLLQHMLQHGFMYEFQSAEGVQHTHRIPPSMPNATFINCENIPQQRGGSDCGWWAVYNALMFILTGKRDFLNQFRERSREPAYKLRQLFNSLDDQLPIGRSKKKMEISKQEQEIYEAIKASQKSLSFSESNISAAISLDQPFLKMATIKGNNTSKDKLKIKSTDIKRLVKIYDLLENAEQNLKVRLTSGDKKESYEMSESEIIVIKKAEKKKSFKIIFKNKKNKKFIKISARKELSEFLAILQFDGNILDVNKYKNICDLIYSEVISNGGSVKSEEMDPKVLLKIAGLCGGSEGISFNDNHDPSTYFIRNRYGYKKRNQGNKENEDKAGRIDFEMLFRVKVLIESGTILPTKISLDLESLKKKISYILYKEHQEDPSVLEDNVHQNFQKMGEYQGDDSDMKIVKDFVSEEYPKLIFNQFKLNIQEINNIKLIGKPFVYALARKFVVIGELLHELSEVLPQIKLQKTNNLFSLFGRFNQLRNGFVHFNFHIALLLLLQGNASKIVWETINQLFKTLLLLCSKVESLTSKLEEVEELNSCKKALEQLSNLIQPSKKKKIRNSLIEILLLGNQLFEILHSNHYKNLKSFLKANPDAFFDPDISNIIILGLRYDSPSQFLSLEKHTNKLVKEISEPLQALLEKLKSFLLNKNIDNLKMEYLLLLEEMENHSFLLENFGSINLPDFNIDTIKFGEDDSIKKVLNLCKKFDQIKKESGSISSKAFSDFFNKLYQNLQKNYKITTPNLESLKKRYDKIKEKILDLEPDDKLELENEFYFSLSLDEFKKIQEFLKQDPILNSFEKPIKRFTAMIMKEMNYLVETELAHNLPMKNLIIQHIVTLVGQYVRDIEERALSNQVFLSYTSMAAGKAAKMLRSKGLAHEVFNFNQERFLQELLINIYPSAADFEAIHYINNSGVETQTPLSSQLYAKLGWSYAQLTIFKTAAVFYQKAIENFSQELPKDELTENSLTNQSQLKSLGITQPKAVLIDFNRFSFGLSDFELSCYASLQKIFLKMNDLENVLNIYEVFFRKINLKRCKDYQETLAKLSDIEDQDKEKILRLMDPGLLKVYKNLVRAIQSHKNPCVIMFGDKILFKTIADIYAGKAYIERLNGNYLEAIRLLSFSIDYIVVKIEKKEMKRKTVINMPSMDNQTLMGYFLELSQCHQEINDSEVALSLANMALTQGEPAIRLLARHRICSIKHKLGTMTDLDLHEYEIEIRSSLHFLKRDYGDEFFTCLEQFCATKINRYIYKRDFDSIQLYLKQLESDFYDQYDIYSHDRLNKLHILVFRSYIQSLNDGLNKNEYEKILNFARERFKLIEADSNIAVQNFKDFAQLLAIAISNYAIFYFTNDKFDNNLMEVCWSKLKYLKEALELQEKHNTNANITLINICNTYNNIATYYLYKEEKRLAEENFLECLKYIDDIDVAKLSNNERIDLHQQYAYCFEKLAEINELDQTTAWLSYCKAFDHSRKALFLLAEKYNSKVYENHHEAFFTPSFRASKERPFGPYSDRLCSQYDPVTIEAQKCSRLAKLKSEYAPAI